MEPPDAENMEVFVALLLIQVIPQSERTKLLVSSNILSIVVTFETTHVERSALNALASENAGREGERRIWNFYINMRGGAAKGARHSKGWGKNIKVKVG